MKCKGQQKPPDSMCNFLVKRPGLILIGCVSGFADHGLGYISDPPISCSRRDFPNVDFAFDFSVEPYSPHSNGK